MEVYVVKILSSWNIQGKRGDFLDEDGGIAIVYDSRASLEQVEFLEYVVMEDDSQMRHRIFHDKVESLIRFAKMWEVDTIDPVLGRLGFLGRNEVMPFDEKRIESLGSVGIDDGKGCRSEISPTPHEEYS